MKLLDSIKLLHLAWKYKYGADKEAIAYINACVKEGQVVIDTGIGKTGYLYALLKKIGPAGKAFAFEPQTKSYQYLTRIKKFFNWTNLTVEHLLISDQEEVALLYITAGNYRNEFRQGPSVTGHKQETGAFTVEGVNAETLDTYCEKKNIRPDFIKIDAAGNELRVLEGGLDILKQCRPRILAKIEASLTGEIMMQEIFDLIHWLRYKGYFLHGTKKMPLQLFTFEKYHNRKDPANYCSSFVFEKE
jgi:FkbM family methyltransferase